MEDEQWRRRRSGCEGAGLEADGLQGLSLSVGEVA